MTWPDWGDAPSVMNAIFTAGALVFAGLAARSTSKQLRKLDADSRRQDDDRRDRDKEKKREQAKQVSVWMDRDLNGQYSAFYSNLSGAPVYNATIDVLGAQFNSYERKPVLAPTAEPVKLERATEALNHMSENDPLLDTSWFVASDKLEVVPKPGQAPEEGEQEMQVALPVGLALTFTDFNNQRWHRKITGQLFPATPTFRTVIETEEDRVLDDEDTG